ncbi:MAG: helix-hairpin-helix domain-containing protein [Lachnospiraceae bacterium]|nr:helix-hairpin-helix domain-containing protein [Lachnospiraceae bacterium]
MNRTKFLYKVLVGIPAVLVCIFFGCQKKDGLVQVPLLTQESSMDGQLLLQQQSPMEQLKEMEAQEPGEADADLTEQGAADEDVAELGAAGGFTEPAPTEASLQVLTEEPENIPEPLLVHICGAVVNPGVYELKDGDRLCHAVEMAGGFLEEADSQYLNQAQKLTDGMQITIPTVAQAGKARQEHAGAEQFIRQARDMSDGGAASKAVTDGSVATAAGQDGGLINLNTATEEALCSLPGIGKERAQSIIAYRNQNGGYKQIEEIMNVTGIKEGMFVKLKDKITVG